MPKGSGTQPTKRVNLSVQDWITVFQFIDNHPGIAQAAVVQHFKTLPDSEALIFNLLQTHINFPRFLPIFPDFLERLSHLAPIY
jgi:hypothetical protein